MRFGKTEQALVLAILVAGVAWVGMLVYARLTPDAPDARRDEARPRTTEAAEKRERDAAPSNPSEMVFSAEEVGTARPSAGGSMILIESRPSGARVFENRELLGRTPLEIPRPAPSDATRYFFLQKTGYLNTRVAVGAASPARITVTLEDN